MESGAMEEDYVVWWVHTYPPQGKKRSRQKGFHPSCVFCTSFWAVLRSGVASVGSGLGSTTSCGQRRRSGDSLNTSYLIKGGILPSWAYSKITMPQFIGQKLWKSGSRSTRHRFCTWIVHHWTLTLLRDC